MADIFVYAPNCEDFDNMGECGPLTCLSARFIEEANGTSELTIEHPIDEDVGRWSFLQEGYLLQAEVPVRTTPEIADGLIVTQTQTWKIKTTATKGERGVYNKASGGKKMFTADIWKKDKKGKILKDVLGNPIRNTVVVVSESDSRYKIKRSKGYGYISKAAVEEGYSNLPLDQTPEAIETIVPAWSIKPQLFRMHAPEITDKKVTVKARHISYDLLGNSATYDPARTHPNWSSSTAYVVGSVVYETNTKLIYFCIKANTNVRPPNATYWTSNPTCGAALAGILRNCAKTHEFEGFTNIADERVISDWIDVSPIEALLSPENGILALWNADLVRDNWELTVLNDAGLNRGVRIEYGKNLTGVKVSLDTSDLITSIRPIGQTSKGKPLYLTAGTYTVDGQTVVVDSSLTVSSSHEGEYPIPHVYTLDLGTAAKATGTSSSAVLAAKNKMVKACLDMFKNEKCDLPLLTLTVEFIALDSTEEYSQYRQLENVYLFDRVTVWHPKIAVDVLTSVQRVEFDPVKESFIKIEVSPVRRDASRKKIPSWKLPPVTKVAYGAVDIPALADGVADTIVPGAQTVVAVESSAGNVIKSDSASSGATLSARTYKGGVENTDTLDASLFSWTRQTSDSSADIAWAEDEAHVGVKTVDITAAEFSDSPAIYRCTVEEIGQGAITTQLVPEEIYKGLTDPDAPSDGQVVLNTTENVLKRWDATAEAYTIIADYNTMTAQIGAVEAATTGSTDFQTLVQSIFSDMYGLHVMGVSGKTELRLSSTNLVFVRDGDESTYLDEAGLNASVVIVSGMAQVGKGRIIATNRGFRFK